MAKRTVAFVMLLPTLLLSQGAGALERTRLELIERDESSLTGGLEYERGDYETPDTTSVWRIPLEYAWRRGDISLGVAVPLLYAESDGTITVSSKTSRRRRGAVPATSTVSGSESASGIGDIQVSGSYHLPADYRRELAYRLTGIVKFGTASSSDGLGTGENDFALEGGAVKQIDEYVLSATLGYEFNGDPDDFDYHDVAYGSIGVAKWLPRKRGAGASLFASEAVIPGADAPLEITAFYRHPVDDRRDLYLYVTRGLSDASPDILLGARLQLNF
jgi:hypothetical protein